MSATVSAPLCDPTWVGAKRTEIAQLEAFARTVVHLLLNSNGPLTDTAMPPSAASPLFVRVTSCQSECLPVSVGENDSDVVERVSVGGFAPTPAN